MGALFDADGDGVAEPIQYNGFSVLDEHAMLGSANWVWHFGIEHMARHCVQGRGVMVTCVSITDLCRTRSVMTT